MAVVSAPDILDRLRQWRVPSSFHFTDDEHLEGMCGSDIRHKSGAQPHDFLRAFLLVARNFGFATRDGTWGELEKVLQIAFRNQVRLMRQAREAADEIERLRRALQEDTNR